MKQLIKKLFSSLVDVKLKDVIKTGAFLVDVRSPGEFAFGSVQGATNIPLDTIQESLDAFKGKVSNFAAIKIKWNIEVHPPYQMAFQNFIT